MNVAFFLLPKQEVAYVYSDFTIRQALEKMRFHRYTSIPVVDRDGAYQGTLGEGDLLWHIFDSKGTAEELGRMPLSDVKRYRHHDPILINANIEDLFSHASDQNFVPVVDDEGRFIGIIRRREIMNELTSQYKSKSSN
ncbi:CBS domain-containing protein [Aureibacillus halotolerans]|uniref:CBS domain-containing protein n=1 Tax=Aureibacillus halotolerans TaxID=1508390 RepID=A0A4V3D4Q8_9BACI|nr:CBS domain-containing protein [Aureibacillus halotolerans]TDQ37197.1 CBS domain-containing protein [Aureibacillus halotolerans]